MSCVKKKRNDCLAVILGGGKGTRLYPLTKERSKPAVPFGGNYRIVDVPISNCINSGINKIFVVTQYNSASLNRHIVQTYRFDMFHEGFVDILASELTEEGQLGGFSEGTADAVRKAIKHLKVFKPKYILVLAGDQLYRMDFSSVLSLHEEKKANLTLCALPIGQEEISRFGVLKVSDEGKIVDFLEKPQTEKTLIMRGFNKNEGKYLGSMGIYLFDAEVLFDELMKNKEIMDFGKEFIPYMLKNYVCYMYEHNGYWEDIGTISSYHKANIDMTKLDSTFKLYDEDFPFFTHPRFLPPAQIVESELNNVLLSPGSQVLNSSIENSVIGVRSIIRRGCVIQSSVIMGSDYYDEKIGIGENCIIKNAIVDKNARIDDGVKIVNKENVQHFRGEMFSIVDGIVVVHKNAWIPSGTII